MLFKPAIYRKYCKRCKFVPSVGRPKPLASGGLCPLTLHQGLWPLDPHWGLCSQTPVIGSRSRSRHVPPKRNSWIRHWLARPLTHATPLSGRFYASSLLYRRRRQYSIRLWCLWFCLLFCDFIHDNPRISRTAEARGFKFCMLMRARSLNKKYAN